MSNTYTSPSGVSYPRYKLFVPQIPLSCCDAELAGSSESQRLAIYQKESPKRGALTHLILTHVFGVMRLEFMYERRLEHRHRNHLRRMTR